MKADREEPYPAQDGTALPMMAKLAKFDSKDDIDFDEKNDKLETPVLDPEVDDRFLTPDWQKNGLIETKDIEVEIVKGLHTKKKKGELNSIRSWVYMITFMLTALLVWGIISSFPVLFVAFLERFHRSRSQTGFIGSLQIGLLYMLAIIPGYLIPKLGYKLIVVIGSMITALGFISSIYVTDVYYLYITMGVVTSLGVSFLMVTVDTVPLVMFKKWRSLASILTASAASVGFTVMPLTAGYLLRKYALNGALLLLAGIMLQGIVLGFLHPFYYKGEVSSKDENVVDKENPNKHLSNISKYMKIIRSPAFWCVSAEALAIDCLSNGSRVFLIDRAMQNNVDQTDAIFALSMWGIFSALSKLTGQLPLINRTANRRQITLSITAFCWALVTLLTVLDVMKSYEGFLAFCILSGTFHGISTLLWYLAIADIMDRDLVVAAYGLQCFIAGPFVMFSIPFAGWLFDRSQSYDVPYIIYGSIGIFGSICIAFIPYLERHRR